MSKDRQQRREQQANVKDGDRTPERFQVADLAKAQADLPTMSAFELDTLGMRLPEVMKRGAGEDDGEFRARLSARLFALVPQPDRAPAEIIEHAERPGGGIVEPEYEKPVDRAALIASLPPVAPLVSCPTCVGQGKVPKPEADRMHSAPPAKDPFFVRRGTLAGPPRNITINATANGMEDPEQLSQAILRQLHAQLIMSQDQSAKPPANIPKAVHHLRRAANALPGDAMRPAIEACIQLRLGVLPHPIPAGLCRAEDVLPDIAAALELDHNTKGAAADVRAAIEALG